MYIERGEIILLKEPRKYKKETKMNEISSETLFTTFTVLYPPHFQNRFGIVIFLYLTI